MKDKDLHIQELQAEIEALKGRLFEATSIIEAIKEGEVDALVVHNNGSPQIYSIESADYTYRILIEKFSQGALSISPTGLILYCNDYFSQLAGIPADKIVGSYLRDYFNDPHAFNAVLVAINNGVSKTERTLYINGKEIPVDVYLSDLQPNVEAVGVVITDLTDKKQHEQALVTYQQQLEGKVNELNATNINLEQFIHVISHDLKEPLRKILMYASRLNTVNTPEGLHPVSVIKSSAVRLNSLVDDLVKYAFIATKDDVDPVSLDKVLKEVKEDLELIITEKNAVIQSSGLPVIMGSGVQMRQLFSNLIANAIKYSKAGSSPVITVSHTVTGTSGSQFYKVNIQDNGIGMDAAHLGKIFTIFQRLHQREEYSGNGIGLAICKKIIENHSGYIEVQSTLGSGSVFSLYFPIKRV